MYIQLDQLDYEAIGKMISNVKDTSRAYIEYEDLIEIHFGKEITKHQENDYYNGTGAWITDNVDFSLFKVECGDIEVKYDEKQLIKTIIEWLL